MNRIYNYREFDQLAQQAETYRTGTREAIAWYAQFNIRLRDWTSEDHKLHISDKNKKTVDAIIPLFIDKQFIVERAANELKGTHHTPNDLIRLISSVEREIERDSSRRNKREETSLRLTSTWGCKK